MKFDDLKDEVDTKSNERWDILIFLMIGFYYLDDKKDYKKGHNKWNIIFKGNQKWQRK